MLYDALVVGAGPAGLMYSRVLSARGFKVVVVEKNEALAAKPCGEGISARVLRTAEISKADHSRFVSHVIKGAVVVAPNGKEVVVKEEGEMGYIIDKKNFLRVMAEYSASSGADVFVKEPAEEVSFRGGHWVVKTRTMELQARLLVGADGYLSFVSKALGLERPGERKVIPTIQYVMPSVEVRDPDMTYFFLGNKIAPKGYVWVFPKDGHLANVGIGVQGGPPKAYLDGFIKKHPEIFKKPCILEFKGAAVTIGGMLSEIVADHALLIGEAAGQVIPLTGGGIHTSIAGGKIAAEVSAAALEEGNLSRQRLSEYKDKYNEYWGRRIKDSLRGLNAIEKLSDEELNQLADILSPEDVVNLANGENIATVAIKLLKHPIFSIKLARALLV
ncbi:MAG: NAD(P)/FAD-dependent oxidoreductase [Thermofilum sp.]|jgi:digeranylgeranylglycerophospholipid reductase|nr:NAD(P)/FAD-dependent oxidoreductase [Thermofilum sp.]